MFDTLGTDTSFDGFGGGQRPTTTTATTGVLDDVTLRDLVGSHGLESPSDDSDGNGVVGVSALASQSDFVVVGVEEPHVGERILVVGTGEKRDEEGLGFLLATDPEGVVFTLGIGDSELSVTGGEELGGLNLVRHG